MDRIQQILGNDKSKESVNTDTFINVSLEGKEMLLPANNLNKIVDAGERFNTERQSSSYYRILGTINPLVSNVLFNMSGPNSWEYLNNNLFVPDSGTTYGDSIKKNLKEIDGWFGYFNPIKSAATLCNFIDMEPKRERFKMITDTTNSNVKNWEFTVTYPYDSDKKHPMIAGGLMLVDTINVSIGGRSMIALGTPVKHNLAAGKTVRISGTSIDGEYQVIRVGLDNGDLKDYYFCLDVNPTTVSIGSASRMIRVVSGKPSEYYFRKFKKVKTRSNLIIENDDYEIYNLAFSENIFTDSVAQYVFNEDIDVSGLVDNLGRPVSELYLTMVKTGSNNIFTPVKSGIECPFISNLNASSITTYLRQVPVIQKIHNGGALPVPSHTPLEVVVDINNKDFYGDVVEFNMFEVKETILGEVHHRFNTINRQGTGNQVVGGPRQEGYYYKAHNLIKIREYSNYIEQGDKSTTNIPNYSVNLGDGRYLWRNLLNIGVNDVEKTGLNYPFVNGCHYMYQNISFEVRRQDPFDNWDLFYGIFPSDPIGNTMNNKFKINTSKNVC